MNYHDYTSVSTQAATPTSTPTSASNNQAYYYSSPLDTTTNGYIITHQHTPSVITYSTDMANTTDTTTIIDTSPYSFSTSPTDQQQSYQHAHNGGYPLYQHQQQQQEEDGTLALNHIQMASNWQNQTNSATPMMPTTDPHFTTLNNDEEFLVPFPERGVAGFVCKLYQSLEAPDGGEKYAHWCYHNGKDMFIIDCIPKFTETVLPKLFKHCKFASFVRQLNIYGFQRDTDARKSKDSKDKEICRWYHTHFRPGRRDLFHLIRRKAPRYSRRKRIKSEQDEEKTSLHSGDDSDQDNGNATLHQSSSPNTSVATTPTMKNMNSVMMYSSPTSLIKNEIGSADSSPMMVSPPPPPISTSATVAASDSPSPQQHQPADHISANVLMQNHHHHHSQQQQQQQQQQLGNHSSTLLLTHQSHSFEHQNQRGMQQDSNTNIQGQHDMCANYQPQEHDAPTSLCLTSPLGMDNALGHAGSTHYIEEPQHPSFQSQQLQHPQSTILHQTQQHIQRTPSTSPPTDSLQQQSNHHFQQMQQLHRPHQQQLLSMDQDPNMYHMMFQAPISSTPTSPSSFYQEELKAHITRLQHEYQQMHTYFTNELGKAREQIKTQRLRSEFLERSLRGEQ